MGLARDMRYDLYYPAAFAVGTRTEGQLAIIDLEPDQDPTSKQSPAHQDISVSAVQLTAEYVRLLFQTQVETLFAKGAFFF